MKVVFVDHTQKAPKKMYIVVAWYIVAFAASIAFFIFVYRPDWLLVPPNL